MLAYLYRLFYFSQAMNHQFFCPAGVSVCPCPQGKGKSPTQFEKLPLVLLTSKPHPSGEGDSCSACLHTVVSCVQEACMWRNSQSLQQWALK